jgi:hypothetical protein
MNLTEDQKTAVREIGQGYVNDVNTLHPAHTWSSPMIRQHLATLFDHFRKPVVLSGPYGNGEVMIACKYSANAYCEEIGPEIAEILKDVSWRCGAPEYGYKYSVRDTAGWFYMREGDLHHLLMSLAEGRAHA